MSQGCEMLAGFLEHANYSYFFIITHKFDPFLPLYGSDSGSLGLLSSIPMLNQI